MTVITGHRCWNMRRGFSLNRAVVMALHTTSRSNTIVRKKGRLPIRRTMATTTVHRCRQVIRRLKG